MSKICALQKAYGKMEAELETLVDGFVWILGDYPAEQVFMALKNAVARSPEIPTPSDVYNLLNPVEEPPSTTLYIDIMKRVTEGDYLWGDDKEFVEKYRDYHKRKALGGDRAAIEEYREADRQIEAHAQAFLCNEVTT